MKRNTIFLTIFALMAFVLFYAAPTALAQSEEKPQEEPTAEHGPNFVDENGDGYNDNAPDEDGDGIPNGQDPDYEKAGTGKGNTGTGFVDENGDGINDNAPDDDGDGIPNGQDEDYVKPADGTGAGKGQGKGLGKGKGRRFAGFVDEDGDGINDRIMDADNDGIPNGKDADWVKPEDCLGRGANMGKGFGKGSQGASGTETNGNSGSNGNGQGKP
jgi:hypothetical protein